MYLWGHPEDIPLRGHTEGLYSVSQAGRLGSLRDRANELPDTLKVGMLLAGYTDEMYQGYFYFKAMNLRRRLRAAYDEALAKYELMRKKQYVLKTIAKAMPITKKVYPP